MGKGRRHNSRAGRPKPKPEEIQALEKARDAYKWLLILALKELPGHSFYVTPAEIATHLAGSLFDVEIAQHPEGGFNVRLRYAVEKEDAFTVDPKTPEEEAELWSRNRVAVLTEEGPVMLGDFRD